MVGEKTMCHGTSMSTPSAKTRRKRGRERKKRLTERMARLELTRTLILREEETYAIRSLEILRAWIMFVQRRTLQLQLLRVQWSQKRNGAEYNRSVWSNRLHRTRGRERFQEQQKWSIYIFGCDRRERLKVLAHRNSTFTDFEQCAWINIRVRYVRNRATCWRMQSSVRLVIAYPIRTAGRMRSVLLIDIRSS